MKELIIGATGFVGSNLARHLPEAMKTARRKAWTAAGSERVIPDHHYFDMLDPEHSPPPDADVVYLCAGVNGNQKVTRQPYSVSYRVNVDGAIWVADYYRDRSAPNAGARLQSPFIVWISSISTEFPSYGGYADQKRQAEMYMRAHPHVAIIRGGLILPSNVNEFCKLMICLGRARKRCLVRWNEDDTLIRWDGK